MKRSVLFVASALLVGVIAGFVIVAQQDEGGDTTAAVTPAGTDPGQDPGTSGNSGSAGGVVPDLVGARLDEAEDRLDGLGIGHEAIGGGLFGIVIRAAWEVCETRPPGGEPARTVELMVERPGQC